MTIRRNTIGRVPTLAGAWDASYVNHKTGHNGYPQKKRVTHLGSEFESLIEDNTYAPATLNQAGTQITFDTEHWLVISNGTDAYLLQNTVNEKLEEIDDVKDAIEAEQASQRESMATMQNTINAKQLEIGAVQTDSVPTQNSGNHMTSGDIYQTLKDSSKGFVDNVPAPDSDKIAKSGGILNSIIQNGPAFDLSAYNDGEKYADLAEALTALNSLPSVFKKGGMSVKFVQSSDNKYVQYRLTVDEWSTNTEDWAIADEGVYVENPEFVYVKTDSEDKVLEGIQQDGTKVIGGDLNVGSSASISGDIKVLGSMEVSGVSYKVIESPEYLAAWIDAENKVLFGLKTDGKTYIGDADFLNDINIKDNQDAIAEIKTTLATIGAKVDSLDIDALSSITATENPEYIEAKTDSEGKLLSCTKKDGSHYAYNMQSETIDAKVDKEDGKSLIDIEVAESQSTIEDSEGRSEIITDTEGKIISYRDSDGVKHEEVGIETQQIRSELLHSTKIETEDLEVKNTQSLKKQLNVDDKNDRLRLPDYGYVNIKSEQFFLEAHSGVTNINDVVPIRVYPDTYDNGQKRMARSFYYVKNTLTDNGDGTYSVNANSVKLRFFASGKVKLNTSDNKYYAKDCVRKINGVCYYHDTLICSKGYSIKDTVLAGYTVEAEPDSSLAEGSAKMVNTEVVPMTGTPCIEAWTVEDFDFTAISGTDIGKKYGHNCIVDVDFGDYYTKNNVPIEVKYQGNSTNSMIKRGLRFTFYKNSNYAKKDKIKIGEMIRLSGFNLKAEYHVPLVKEYVTYKLINDVWNSRPITDRFDWDNKVNGYFHEATGTMKTFPTRVDIGSDFYGIYFFGTKKDEKTCMLDGEDESGLYISASTNGSNAWGVTLPYDVTANYEDEMLDELSPSTIAALETWHHFIHNRLYKGSDNNEYNITELTEVAGNMYVTSTLVGGEVVADSIMATLIEFNKQNIPDRLDVLGFIDYLIFIQVFFMTDSWHNNMMLYSNAEKKKIWPFFYDVDNSWGGGNQDFVEYIKRESNGDMSLWEDFMDIYWDDIVNRYHLLRKEIINESHINAIHDYICNIIPEGDYANETGRWGRIRNRNEFIPYISALIDRLEYLDKTYYK